MKITFEEVINNMKKAYFDAADKEVIPFSDTENRIKAAASEIYAAYTYADYIFKQAFVQTASGKYLDYHAELRGLKRKKAFCASGVLTFTVNEPLEEDVIIPEGTICSPAGKPFIQFATTEKAVIKAGELSADSAATAIDRGSRFNVDENEINVVVNPPKYINTVANTAAFTGGTDNESDESLRKRLLDIYKYENNALNISSVKNAVISCEGVLDADIFTADKHLEICLKTPKNDIENESEIKSAVLNKLSFLSLMGIGCIFSSAKAKPFNVNVDVKAYSGADFEKISNAVSVCLTDYCKTEKIGAEISAADLAMAAAGVDYVTAVNVFITPSVSGSASCGTNEFLKLNDLQVKVHG